MKPFAIASLGLVLALGSARAECALAGADLTAEGKLLVGRFHDGMGRPETALILAMAMPVCLRGPGEDDNVRPTRKVQVFGDTDAISAALQKLVGQRIRVTGSSMPAMTVHHHEPALIQVKSLQKL